MKENFITLFNYNYLPQGLTLYYSLKKKLPKSKIWVVCMDRKVEKDLKKRNLPDLKTISLKKIENQRLKKIKVERKFIEYCWTLTPFLPSYFFKNNKSTKFITYLDADIFFYKNPEPIIREFLKSKKSILLTEHGFHPNHDISEISGRFCVQYMIYKNDVHCKKILKWWQEKCLDWCHDYPDEGRLGDQKYLDEWPKLFKNYIHISKNKKYFQAPWTSGRFKNKDKIIYHFHGLKINSKKIYSYNNYGFTKEIINGAYIPYIKELKKVLNNINSKFYQISNLNSLFRSIKYLIRYKFLKKKKLNQLIFNLENINEKN